MTRVAFLGLGVMGYPMAGHLMCAGHEVVVFNRTAKRAGAWRDEHGGRCEDSAASAVAGADIVMTCLGRDEDVREVVLGDAGVLASMDAGSVLVDHTTTSADLARELSAACAERDIGFVDAPVSGGQAGAENGVLTVMCGGEKSDFEAALPSMKSFARAVTRLGPAGAGQLTKMVNQICIAGLVQALSEGVQFARKAGLDAHAVFDCIDKGAAQSWQMDNRAHTMLEGEFDFGFAVEWMRKDLGYAIDEAARCGAEVPVAELVRGFYEEVAAMGGSRWDTSSLVERLRRPV